MRIHHISCGAFRPPVRPLTFGGGSVFARGDYVVHCLLLEYADRLVLVDTGLGRDDMAQPLRSLGWGMAWGGGAASAPTALEHVQRLGAGANDVSDIVMTHLDKDHAGGLRDFPQARVHVHPAELDAAMHRRTFIQRERYSARHFAHDPQWQPLDLTQASEWHGLQVYAVPGVPNVLMVELLGHSAGHCGIAVPRDDGRWLLNCGDAVYHAAWLHGGRPPLAVQVVETILQHDGAALRETRGKLRKLMADENVTVFCSHDPVAFQQLVSAPVLH